MNSVNLVGRLTRDVELRYIAGSGTPVANFSIAIDREYTSQDGKRETDFVDIQVWGKSAETCAQYVGKGSLVGVQGSIRIDSYVGKDGSNRRSFRINANRVQFLSSNNKSTNKIDEVKGIEFEPNFGADFTAINDDEMPF